MSLTVSLLCHRDYSLVMSKQMYIEIGVDDDDEDAVCLFLGGGEEDGTWRRLLPEEARALAAALKHYANEVER